MNQAALLAALREAIKSAGGALRHAAIQPVKRRRE